MDLRAYLTALRKGWYLIVGGAVLGLAAGYLLTALTPKVYQGTVTFYVSTPLSQESNVQASGTYAQQRVNSYVELIASEEVAKRVREQAGVDLEPTDIQKKIHATAELNTVLVTATVDDTDRARCQDLATALSTVFPTYADELDNQKSSSDTTRGPVVLVQVVSGPTLESTPISPRPLFNLALGLAAGLALGLALALLRQLLDTRVRSSEGAARASGHPVLGQIPFDPKIEQYPVASARRGSAPRGEAIRKLRTNLRFLDLDGSSKVVAVTSAVAAEGKTHTAVNLAAALAEAGERVLLIGGDLRKPRLGDLLGVPSAVGLTDVILGDSTFDHAVQEYGTTSLHVLAAGETPPNPSELLSSERMREVIEHARERYDRVILDCAPLLPVADGAVLAALADGVLLVAREGYTKRAQLAEARATLATVGANLFGMVLVLRRRSKATTYGYGPSTEEVRPASMPAEALSSTAAMRSPQR